MYVRNYAFVYTCTHRIGLSMFHMIGNVYVCVCVFFLFVCFGSGCPLFGHHWISLSEVLCSCHPLTKVVCSKG